MNRIQLRLALACAALLGLAACGDDDNPMIMFPDSGVTDAGTDAGSGETDAGGGGVCVVAATTGFPPLPMTAACLPRCSASTLTALSSCETAECQSAALMADTFPTTTLSIGGDTEVLNCNLCFNWQANSCVFDSCPSEFEAWATCLNGGGDCAAEEGAIDACVDENLTAVQQCAFGAPGSPAGRAIACFDTGAAGFLPFTQTSREIRMEARDLKRMLDPRYVR